MEKIDKKYLIDYFKLRESVRKEVPNNLMLFSKEKILLDEIIDTAGKEFIGEFYSKKNDLKIFYSDENSIEQVISETGNLDFFAERKIINYKIIKKQGGRGLLKDSKKTFRNYFDNYNPDIMLIMTSLEKEYSMANYEDFTHKNLSLYFIDDIKNLPKWIKSQFAGYRIKDETIEYFLQFTDESLDDISMEIEKLKTFCYKSGEITKEAIDLCTGFSRNFTVDDFIDTLFSRDKEKAIKIYNNIQLREDKDLLLIFRINSALIAVSKLLEPETSKLSGFGLYRELKIWNEDKEKTVGTYRSYLRQIDEYKLKKAFNIIHYVTKKMRTATCDNKNLIIYLINEIADL